MEQTREDKELTLKQRKFIGGYLEGKPLVQAAVEAGYAHSTAARGATELLRSPKVRTAIQEALERAGVTDECLANIIQEGLAALKITHLIHKGKIKPLGAANWHDGQTLLVDTQAKKVVGAILGVSWNPLIP